MFYGDEYCIDINGEFDPEQMPARRLAAMFKHAHCITRFESTPDQNFIHDLSLAGFEGSLCYRIDKDRMIEINEALLKKPVVLRNRVADLISFQFVSTVKRSEYLGKRKNVHDLGPALIVSTVPKKETTYRMPKANVPIQHVVVHTTLSDLLQRMAEQKNYYPTWLQDVLDGNQSKPQQRVFFLEDVHHEAIWSCFHLPVEGTLLGRWMSAKFDELLCIGLQILKNSQNLTDQDPVDLDLPHVDKIRRARTVLSMVYANPPPIPILAQQLGISETRLKSGFKSLTGTTVMQFCISKRIDAARLLLKENHHSISEIGGIVGYEDHSAFSRAFRRRVGFSPKEWRHSHTA